MGKPRNPTKITLLQDNKEVSASLASSDIECTEFMEIVEQILYSSKYSKHEIEDYIVRWGDDILATKGN